MASAPLAEDHTRRKTSNGKSSAQRSKLAAAGSPRMSADHHVRLDSKQILHYKPGKKQQHGRRKLRESKSRVSIGNISPVYESYRRISFMLLD
jgi:hypothetical protein